MVPFDATYANALAFEMVYFKFYRKETEITIFDIPSIQIYS